MTSSPMALRTESADAGFATPAAAAISLAIALIASAVMTLCVTTLRHERDRLAQLRVHAQLDGGVASAELTLMGSTATGPMRWSLPGANGALEVVAEPEASKLGLTEAASLDDSAFEAWQVTSAGALKAELTALASRTDQTADLIAPADPSPTWRRCARSAISPYGTAKSPPNIAYGLPTPGTGAARVSQLWRIRLASSDGWVEDRIVRFTGSLQRPVSVASDWFGRGSQLGGACANLGA